MPNIYTHGFHIKLETQGDRSNVPGVSKRDILVTLLECLVFMLIVAPGIPVFNDDYDLSEY